MSEHVIQKCQLSRVSDARYLYDKTPEQIEAGAAAYHAGQGCGRRSLAYFAGVDVLDISTRSVSLGSGKRFMEYSFVHRGKTTRLVPTGCGTECLGSFDGSQFEWYLHWLFALTKSCRARTPQLEAWLLTQDAVAAQRAFANLKAAR